MAESYLWCFLHGQRRDNLGPSPLIIIIEPQGIGDAQ